MRISNLRARFCLLAIALPLTLFFGQLDAAGTDLSSAAKRAGERRVSLTRSVEPSFRVEPVVERLKGRRGETLPFSFELTSTGKSMSLDVRPVNLRQEESGIILHDDTADAMEGVHFTSPTEFQLAPGETFRIEGSVTVPLTKTNYISFGLLVKDSGRLSETPKGQPDDGSTHAAIRFVTQYVLRVDIETGAQDAGNMDDLYFENATLIQKKGLPFVQAYLVNPTSYALESQVRASIQSDHGDSLEPLSLGMQSRNELPGNAKYLVRIMPKSRLRLEGPVSELLESGGVALNIKLSNGRRTMVNQSFPVEIDSSDFRAMHARVKRVGNGVTIHPTQVELGRVAGTHRVTTLQVTNSGERDCKVELVPRDHAGNPTKSVMLSSKKFTVRSGRTQTVRAMLRGRSEDSYEWGVIDIRCDQSTTSLDMALVHEVRPEVQLVAGEMQWANLPSGNAFVMNVDNQGDGYAPLWGEMKMAATSGHPVELADGFGRWLAPGKSRELQFFVPKGTKPGTYQISTKITSLDGFVVAERTLVLDRSQEMLTP
ncbi:COG1470 family protein [Neorhodopirellula lusitana]|uniref:COG1470 family protein n=1 Tax=Neorhodopirellula lusitana TaxID=445327 RepID=UPI00384AE025